jgi:hypothetical protein
MPPLAADDGSDATQQQATQAPLSRRLPRARTWGRRLMSRRRDAARIASPSRPASLSGRSVSAEWQALPSRGIRDTTLTRHAHADGEDLERRRRGHATTRSSMELGRFLAGGADVSGGRSALRGGAGGQARGQRGDLQAAAVSPAGQDLVLQRRLQRSGLVHERWRPAPCLSEGSGSSARETDRFRARRGPSASHRSA